MFERLEIKQGEEVELEQVLRKLIDYEYNYVAKVSEYGDFSLRGGLLDIYPLDFEKPVRIELFDRTVESIRVFNIHDGRREESLERLVILPKPDIKVSRIRRLQFELGEGSPIKDFFDMEPEDYVVHINHGIGKYLGMRKLRVEKRDNSGSDELVQTSSGHSHQSHGQNQNQNHGQNQSQNEADSREIVQTSSGHGQNHGQNHGQDKSNDSLPSDKGEYEYRYEPGYSHYWPYRWYDEGWTWKRVSKTRPDFQEFLDKKKKPEMEERQFLALEYADGDILYVPENQSHMVRKYIGIEGRAPRLYKLGTNSWQRVKEKTQAVISDIAIELLQLQAARSSLTGYQFSPDTDWQYEFEKKFPYEETPDQVISTIQTKIDMESSKPMDRLVCGDVGYGKTEVALRAAFKAVMDYKQVAMLVPTTILAQQHYRTFSQRLKDYPINVQMLSRFKSPAQQKTIITGMREGDVDMVIGTHRLLSNDIVFKDLGLVIIDEEQRFGVRHKEKLKHLRLLVDVLTLTATPIPRTLYSSLIGVRDMSIITTPPKDRIPIKTCVTYFRNDLIKDVIERELDRGGQVYFVHNRVEFIDQITSQIQKLVPRARIAIGHGQMEEDQLEQVMIDFIEQKVDILISTTIIESGLDIPNVNTIIINRADTFGLSDLYQLKGRVGRFKHQAYAYFLVPRGKELNREAQKRLEVIEKFTELGSGFKVAMEDLEIRGAGNLLGHEQSGYIYAVGFDLYCKMIKEAVEGQSHKVLARTA